MKKLSKSIRTKLTIIFISILIFSCLASLGVVIAVAPTLSEIVSMDSSRGVILLLCLTILLCAAVGSILMVFASKYISEPIKIISANTKEVAKGNFEVEIQYESQDEIGLLAKNFNLMTRELRSMEYLRKDFMSNVSHEFKTPISSIQGFAELIKNNDLPKEIFEEYTDIIIQESKRLNNLSSNMLRLSRLDNQLIQNKKVCFSLDEQIRKTILLLEECWSSRNIELEIDLARVIYEGDEELIQQIWINLIGNAIKFSKDYGIIYISLKDSSRTIIIDIKDEGVGMPDNIQPHIFEKFYKGDSSRSESGNGLGLAIVKRIIEICYGTISFQSKEELGTCFTITLPK
jgi:signal transduction histidine kinase